LSISVRLRNLIRGGLGPIWAVSAIEEEEMFIRMNVLINVIKFDFVFMGYGGRYGQKKIKPELLMWATSSTYTDATWAGREDMASELCVNFLQLTHENTPLQHALTAGTLPSRHSTDLSCEPST
jgi:hypothetical protein